MRIVYTCFYWCCKLFACFQVQSGWVLRVEKRLLADGINKSWGTPVKWKQEDPVVLVVYHELMAVTSADENTFRNGAIILLMKPSNKGTTNPPF